MAPDTTAVHPQSHKVGEKCKVPDYIGSTRFIEAQNSCVDIGPFMSEREANRLGAVLTSRGEDRAPLGMEVEK